jgi:hypothetical protein
MRCRAPVLLGGATALLAAALWLAVSLTSADARTRPSDVQATLTYLQAEIAVDQTLVDNVHRGIVAGEELAARISRECPGVAAGAPSVEQSPLHEKLVREVVYAAIFAFVTPDIPAHERAAKTLSHLRWSDHRLTALVHQLGRESTGALGPPPDLCGDWKAWVESGYKVLPAGTMRLLAQTRLPMGEPGPELPERIEAKLDRYEGPRERSMVRRLERFRGVIPEHTAAGVLLVAQKVQAALGLPSTGPLTPNGGPTALTIQPPPDVVRSDGRRLSEFYLGRTVAAQSGCLACHRIGEAGNSGPGPDLTHVASRLPGRGIARVLVKPTPPMPSFRRLPRAKFEALVEFLSLLR